jgi:hypothetical protein
MDVVSDSDDDIFLDDPMDWEDSDLCPRWTLMTQWMTLHLPWQASRSRILLGVPAVPPLSSTNTVGLSVAHLGLLPMTDLDVVASLYHWTEDTFDAWRGFDHSSTCCCGGTWVKIEFFVVSASCPLNPKIHCVMANNPACLTGCLQEEHDEGVVNRRIKPSGGGAWCSLAHLPL